MPGKITALNGRVYWHDVTEADNFIHVVDASSGKEVYSFGNMGDGPNDFAMPIPSVSTEGFYLSDLQKGIEHLFVSVRMGLATWIEAALKRTRK